MNDLISRKAAIRWVKTECNPYGKPTLDFESGKKVIEHLEQMTPAQPERKHGKWVDPATIDVYRCSVCEEYTKLEVPGLFYHYCPNCGTEMEIDNE